MNTSLRLLLSPLVLYSCYINHLEITFTPCSIQLLQHVLDMLIFLIVWYSFLYSRIVLDIIISPLLLFSFKDIIQVITISCASHLCISSCPSLLHKFYYHYCSSIYSKRNYCSRDHTCWISEIAEATSKIFSAHTIITESSS